MALSDALKRLSPDEYLAEERRDTHKQEYLRGPVTALAGASPSYNRVVFNLAGILHSQLRQSGCHGFGSDLKVQTPGAEMFAYPDLTIVCGEPQLRDVLLNPTVIVEVLSESTEARDRGEQFLLYIQIPSLRDYLLVSQNESRIEHYARQPDNRCLLSVVNGVSGDVYLSSIRCRIPLGEVYEGVDV